MAKNTASVASFMVPRQNGLPSRPLDQILSDFLCVHQDPLPERAQAEAAACIRCADPLCRSVEIGGCPLRNPINIAHQLMAQGRWDEAFRRFFESNPFMDLMGACPAPCMHACVAGHHFQPIGIKSTEQALFAHGLEHGLISPPNPKQEQGITVGIVGSGPAGLAAAWVLRQAGFRVHLFEASDLLGGLLIEGIPEFHLAKAIVARRIEWMKQAGILFHPNTRVGSDGVPLRCTDSAIDVLLGGSAETTISCQYMILALGAKTPRSLPREFPGGTLGGVHQAMDLLIAQNRVGLGLLPRLPISLENEQVVVIGGGLTGLDVRSTAVRHAVPLTISVVRKPMPTGRAVTPHWLDKPDARLEVLHFPEGGETRWGAKPLAFLGERSVRSMRLQLLTGETTEVPATRVFLALGFLGPGVDPNGLVAQLGLNVDEDGFVLVSDRSGQTSHPRILAVGDCTTNPQRLIVNAVADGRDAARALIERMV